MRSPDRSISRAAPHRQSWVSVAADAVSQVRGRRVLLVAGATGAGKTTFLRKLVRGDLDHLVADFEPPISGRLTWPDGEVFVNTDPHSPWTLCHYNIATLARHYRRDPAGLRDWLSGGKVVTLWAAPAVLRARLLESEFQGVEPEHRGGNWNRWIRCTSWMPPAVKALLKAHYFRGSALRKLMSGWLGITPHPHIYDALRRTRDREFMAALYERWSAVWRNSHIDHLVIDTSDGSYQPTAKPPWLLH